MCPPFRGLAFQAPSATVWWRYLHA